MRRRLRFERPRLGSAERRGRPAVRGLRPTPPIRSCSLGGAQLRNGGVFKQTAPPPFTPAGLGQRHRPGTGRGPHAGGRCPAAKRVGLEQREAGAKEEVGHCSRTDLSAG